MRGKTLALAAMLAMTANLPVVQAVTRKEIDWWGDRKEPENTGRRAEKDARAKAKAEEKRKRRAAKRAALLPPNCEVRGGAAAERKTEN